jgi:hypothetical protein
LLIKLISSVPVTSCTQAPHQAKYKQIREHFLQALNIFSCDDDYFSIEVIDEVTIEKAEERLNQILVD